MSKEKHRFYAPSEAFSGDQVVLPEDEGKHALKVLRVVEGDQITVTDGEGGTYRVRIDSTAGKQVAGTVLSRTENEGEPEGGLHIALGVLHQPARWETFLEKAVELGCTRITPMITERTQTSRLKDRRLHQIMISAMKQSGRSRLPILDAPTEFAALLDVEAKKRVICHEARPDGVQLPELVASMQPSDDLVALIGPEGGFSEGEVRMAEEKGWTTVWLGKRRLRAETAAMAVVSMASLRG